MEFNCPTCQTKLGVSDELADPKVRCRVCGTIFRPFESGVANRPNPQSQASPSPSQVSPFPGVPESTTSSFPFESKALPEHDDFTSSTSPIPIPRASRPVITPRPQQNRGRNGGWGIMIFIVFILLTRAPRILRNFMREPEPPAPIQIDHDEIRRELNEIIEENERRENERRENEVLPKLPDGADPTELNFELESP